MRVRDLTVLSTLCNFASADWQFRSRPDLSPPRLNITIPASSDVDKGLIFIAPYTGIRDSQHGPRQGGPYIFRDNGELVWSGYGVIAGWAANFQAGKWRGNDVLFSFEGSQSTHLGHGHGHITFLDQHYETVKVLKAGNHKLVDAHEFQIVDEETGLLGIYQPVPYNLTAYGGSPAQQWVISSIFQEIDVTTGKVIFEWDSLDHASPEESALLLNHEGFVGTAYNSSDAWDYFHLNSIDKNSHGDYLVSARNTRTVYKINGTSGQIIWRLGGKKSNFSLGPGVEFSFQHHARFLSESEDGRREVISLFDNAAHNPQKRTHPFSQGKVIKLDTEAWKATLSQTFEPPDKLTAYSQGNAQILPHGGAFVSWGSAGAITEFKSDGTPIFHAYLDSLLQNEGVQNYRGFRFNWTGLPTEAPAIVSLRDEHGTAIHVSWNGDTEAAIWKFYEVSGASGLRRLLGFSKREGFETKFTVKDRFIESAVAQALSEDGRVLTSTDTALTKEAIKPYKAQFEYDIPEVIGRTQDSADWERTDLK